MIILRKKYIYDKNHTQIDVQLDKTDTGVNFADILGECEIVGHIITRFSSAFGNEEYKNYKEYVERCEVCEMERDVREYDHYDSKSLTKNLLSNNFKPKIKYGKWRPSPCYECEENCIINRPIENFNCPECGEKYEVSGQDGILHSNGDTTLLFDCEKCHTRDMVID